MPSLTKSFVFSGQRNRNIRIITMRMIGIVGFNAIKPRYVFDI